MFGVGTGEILLILVIAMLVVGPERMVEFSRTMGRMIAQFRHTTDEATKEFREAFSFEELQDLKKEVESAAAETNAVLRSAADDTNAVLRGDGSRAPSLPASASAQGAIPAKGAAEPVEKVTLKEVLGDELVDGEIEVEAPAQPVPAEAQAGPAAEAAEAISLDVASLVPEDPDVEPTTIETVEVAPQEESTPSPEAIKG